MEVLVSCMYQHDFGIVQKSGINSNVLIINQCDNDQYVEVVGDNGRTIRMISTTERGISKSRNMALSNAMDNICLFCDDDEKLNPDYETIILNAFEDNPQADLIAFWVDIPSKKGKYLNKSKRIKYIDALKISSVQIAFRRERICNNHIQFDILMGSGTNNGGGEEVKFLFDCLRKGLKILYVPHLIGSVAQTDSRWFHGFTPRFMRNQGWSSRRIMGPFWGYIYVFLFIFRKFHLFKNDCSFLRALKEIHIGFFEKRF